MNPALVTMIVLGCNHGEADCNFIREVDTRFETEAACQLQADAELIQTKQSEYPVVMVVCKAQDNILLAENETPTGDNAADAPNVVMAPEFTETDQPENRGEIRRFAYKLTVAARNFGSAVAGGFRSVFSPRNKSPAEPIELGRQG